MTGLPLFLRTHLVAAAVSLLLGEVLLSLLITLSDRFFVVMGLFCAALAVYGLIDENKRIRFGYRKGSLSSFGQIIGFCAYPRPGTSLLKALDCHASVEPQEIEEIKFQTCTFSNPYLEKLSAFFADSGVKNNISIEILGVGDEGGLSGIKQTFPNLKVLHTTHKLHSHFNLVKARGQYYLWYEPEHDDVGKRYIPSKGAFLVVVDDVEKALNHFYKDCAPDPTAVASY